MSATDASFKPEEVAAGADHDCSGSQGFISATQLDSAQVDKAEKAVINFYQD